MPKFTVIGYYPDNNQLYSCWFDAEDWMEAINQCREGISSNLVVTAVLNGVVAPADDMDEAMEVEPLDEEGEDDE